MHNRHFILLFDNDWYIQLALQLIVLTFFTCRNDTNKLINNLQHDVNDFTNRGHTRHNVFVSRDFQHIAILLGQASALLPDMLWGIFRLL